MSDIPIIWADDLLSDATEGDGMSWFRKDKAPGTAAWVNGTDGQIAALEYVCPCGCGRLGCVSVNKEHASGPFWNWDGDRERPTLTPSIYSKITCGWHGYLTAGVFRSV